MFSITYAKTNKPDPSLLLHDVISGGISSCRKARSIAKWLSRHTGKYVFVNGEGVSHVYLFGSYYGNWAFGLFVED